jgi:hypothetical protein
LALTGHGLASLSSGPTRKSDLRLILLSIETRNDKPYIDPDNRKGICKTAGDMHAIEEIQTQATPIILK